MRTRRGVTIIELVAAMVLLAALLSSMSLAISRIVVQRHRLNQRNWANQATANVMEQLDSLPYSQLTESELGALALPANTDDVLPSASLRCMLEDQPHTMVPGKRIRVVLQWKDRVNAPPNELQLVTWRYSVDRTQP